MVYLVCSWRKAVRCYGACLTMRHPALICFIPAREDTRRGGEPFTQTT
jgi:hypothetical protein